LVVADRWRRRPGGIVSDIGIELTSTAILAWSDRQNVAWLHRPGKPGELQFAADRANSLLYVRNR